MRIGIDIGGTKIEAIALNNQGEELVRKRVSTPRGDYEGTIRTMVQLISSLEMQTGETGSVGIGIPGILSPKTGLMKNANSTWLIGKPFNQDVMQALSREVRFANDANCLAVSEAVDGAGAGAGAGAVSTSTSKTAGRRSGRTTRRNVVHAPAPRSALASSRSLKP